MNNKELVVYAKNALKEGWGYVWGTFGQLLTPELLSQKLNQYPSGVGSYLAFIKTNWLGRKVTDCVGLIKGFYWTVGGQMKYNGTTDVTADGMYSNASIKGPISNIPEIAGLCVWKPGHIGVYIGNGQVIEAHGTTAGVIQSPLKGGTPWTHWLRCPYITYEVAETPALKPVKDTFGTVTATVLNVRSTPEVKSNNIIGQLRKGDKVKIDKELINGWTSIYFGNHGGYISSQYLK